MDKHQNAKDLIPIKKTCALVITHHPDEKLITLLNSLGEQVTEILVVDNGSKKTASTVFNDAKVVPGINLIENSNNLGVATALNQGFKWAQERGYQWMITFDQDSQPEGNFVKQLCSTWKVIDKKKDIGIIAPQILDANLGKKSLFLRRRFSMIYERVGCQDTVLEDVTYVITSGAMVNTQIAEEIGGFREDFFIDYVDTEFCLRARKHGYRILVACEAKIHHYFGERKHIRWGPVDFYPSFHSPERWYTMSRNRIPMILTYGLKFPHWFTYEIVATGYILLRMLLTEDQKGAKLGQFLRGTWDGLRGRMGPPYWAKEEK